MENPAVKIESVKQHYAENPVPHLQRQQQKYKDNPLPKIKCVQQNCLRKKENSVNIASFLKQIWE